MVQALLVLTVLLLLIGLVSLRALRRRLGALSRLEGKLDALLEKSGVRFDPFADVPPEVVESIRRGEKIQAIKLYRTASGLGLKESKEFIEELQRRGGLGR